MNNGLVSHVDEMAWFVRGRLLNQSDNMGLALIHGDGAFMLNHNAGQAMGAADDATKAAKVTDRLTDRADEIQSVLDPIAIKQRTTAILETDAGDIIGGGVRDLNPAQRALQKEGDVLAKLPGEHAEITVLQEAVQRGAKPRAIAASRNFCNGCIEALESMGATITGSRTAIWL